jgi:hypothetical protein
MIDGRDIVNDELSILGRSLLLALAVIVLLAQTGCLFGHDVDARRWNEAEQCWGAKEEAGYYDGPTGCDANAPITTDADGNYWQFSSGCVPDGYERVDDADLLAEMGGAPLCGG